jgi:hypothetical protein
MTLRRASLAFSFGLVACSSPSAGGNDDAGSSSTTPVETSGGETSTTVPPADSSTSTTAQPETGGGSSSSSTTEVDPTFVFDMGVIPDAPVVKDPGCHAVDFLFVIDNSGSMADDQAKLIMNFPTFAEGIVSTLDQVTSYHVGVVTTDAYFYNAPGCQQLGSLVTKTGGFDSSNMVCGPFEDGYNFMTENDDLAAEFTCTAQVGTEGSGTELPMDTIVNVMSGVQDGPGLCNEDFMREDALLVIVVITDEYDGPGDPEGAGSMGDHDTWYDAVIAAKNDTPENAVALALVHYYGGMCPPPDIYSDGAEIIAWVELFEENGFYGGICEADYGPIFAEATGVIEEACNNFIPPG